MTDPRTHSIPPRRTPASRNTTLNIIVGILVLIVGYLLYAFIARQVQPPVESVRSGGSRSGEVIQVDVLNGCGVARAASRVTSFLRERGYDVVEMRNYKSFDVQNSLVIDRSGDLQTARKVAYALGVKEKNIVQQINHDYYVDVSIVVGKDFGSLKVPQ